MHILKRKKITHSCKIVYFNADATTTMTELKLVQEPCEVPLHGTERADLLQGEISHQ